MYNQHKRYFLKHGIVTCPREKFKCDLIEAIRTCNKNGEQIILCIDMNEDFTRHNGPLYTALTEEVSLYNVLTTKNPHLPPPSTQDTGTRPIDAIMVSKTLLGIDYGGWLQFGACIGDHRPAYININLKTLIDKKKYDIVTAKAQRLQIGNAKALEKYLRYVEREFRKERLLPRVEELTKKITSGAKINKDELEEIDKLRVKNALKGERQCRRIRAGEVPYSPTDVQKYCKLYHLWNLVV